MPITVLTNSAAGAAQKTISASAKAAEGHMKSISDGVDYSKGAADKAKYNQLSSDISALGVAIGNTSEAGSISQFVSGNIDKMVAQLKRARELAIASNKTSESQDKLDYNDLEFQQMMSALQGTVDKTRWGSTSLLAGGAGTATLKGAVTGAADGLNAVANAFAGTMTGQTGNITGSAASISVEKVGVGYNVKLTLDNGQVFEAKGNVPKEGEDLVLVSKSGATIPLDFDATAVTAITNAATYKSSLESCLGLVADKSSAKFMADSVAASNGITGVSTATTTAAGNYALSMVAASNELVLSDDKGNSYTAAISETGAAQTITFANNFSVTFSGAFDDATAISQTMVTVASGTQTTLSFQTNLKGREDLAEVKIAGLSVASLGLTGANVKTPEAAKDAQDAIAAALVTLNTVSAQINATQKRLGFDAEVAEGGQTSMTNTASLFNDVDPAKAITALTQEKVRNQIATAMLTQANEMQQSILTAIR